jgi:hypothetical protein
MFETASLTLLFCIVPLTGNSLHGHRIHQKVIRESHAVPPVGWRRTNRGWEYLNAVPQVLARCTPQEPPAAVNLIRSIPPWAVSLFLIASAWGLVVASPKTFNDNPNFLDGANLPGKYQDDEH